jgi:HEAT repeat protein
MSDPGSAAARRARAAHEDEETRYRAVGELDAADAGDRAVILDRLADPSWRVRSAAVERIAAAPGAAAVPELMEVLAWGPGVGAREAAAAALARVGSPAVPALVERLAHQDPDLQQAAAGVLGAISDGRAVPPLTARLADPDPNVRAAAADALGKIGSPQAIASLRAAVDSDDPTLRLSAVEALGALRVCLPSDRIEELLSQRPLRKALYRMLGFSDEPHALLIVARGVADPSRPGREAALGALGHQRARRDADEVTPALAQVHAAAERDPGLADAWAAALGSEEPFVVAGAITALAIAGAARHAGHIVKLAEDERYRTLVEATLERFPDAGGELREALAEAIPTLGQLARITALAALAQRGSPAAFESVVREASDPESYVQAEAIAALGRLRDTRGVPPLAGLLADDDAGTAALASTALVRIGQSGPAERAAVLVAARDRGDAIRSQAVYRTLGALGDAEDVPFVLCGLGAPGVAERAAATAAMRALAQRGLLSIRDASALVAALSDPAWGVRAAAARAIADLASARGGSCAAELAREASGALVGALRDTEQAVRAAAAEALGACGRAEDAAAIGALVADADAPAVVVVAALHALVALGQLPGAALERALAHGDPEVVKEAVLGAARVPGAEGQRILREAAASPRWDVRRAAARAFQDRNDPALRADAERLAATDPDPFVARAFAEAARAIGPR